VTHVLISFLGLALLFVILRSMIRIALMNRHYRDSLAEFIGRAVHKAVAIRLGRKRDAQDTHSVLLWLFPAYILLLIIVYFVGAMTAFVLLYWGSGAVSTWGQAFLASGSALNTLGFATPTDSIGQWIAIPEGALGLGIVVFLFTFIPGYQEVIRSREDQTSWLYVRTGNEPSGVTMLEWSQRAGIAGNMRDIWEAWEDWFRMLGDTHSVLPCSPCRLPCRVASRGSPLRQPCLTPPHSRRRRLRLTTLKPLESVRKRERVHFWRLPTRSGRPDRPLRPPERVYRGRSMKPRELACARQEYG